MNGKWLIKCMEFLWGMIWIFFYLDVLKLIVMIAAQLCEYIKNHTTDALSELRGMWIIPKRSSHF